MAFIFLTCRTRRVSDIESIYDLYPAGGHELIITTTGSFGITISVGRVLPVWASILEPGHSGDGISLDRRGAPFGRALSGDLDWD